MSPFFPSKLKFVIVTDILTRITYKDMGFLLHISYIGSISDTYLYCSYEQYCHSLFKRIDWRVQVQHFYDLNRERQT